MTTPNRLWNALQAWSSRLGGAHERSRLATANILLSGLFQGGVFLLSLALVPLTLAYLGTESYGLWVTASSVAAWLGLADAGIGSGLRTKLGEAMARGDAASSRGLVSAAYAVVGAVAVALAALLLLSLAVVPWGRLLNAPEALAPEVKGLVLWVLLFFMARLLFQLVGAVLQADQRAGAAQGLLFAATVATLGALLGLRALGAPPSLSRLAFWVGGSVALVYLAANLVYFVGRYRAISPSPAAVQWTVAKEMAGISGQYFALQISGLVIFLTDNLIVAHLFGPEAVTPYSIAYRYFFSLVTLFSLVANPYWSAVTEARVKGDFDWIRSAYRRVLGYASVLGAGALLLAFASPLLLRLWVGAAAPRDPLLLGTMALYVVLYLITAAMSAFINGFGTIRVNLYAAVFGACVNLPLAVLLSRLPGVGSAGVAMAGILALLPSTLLVGYQLHLHLAGKAEGVWAR